MLFARAVFGGYLGGYFFKAVPIFTFGTAADPLD